MTKRAKKTLSDLMKNNTHPPGCDCAACLYEIYKRKNKEVKINRIKKPFGKMTFYINWLIDAVKMDYLRRKNRVSQKTLIDKHGRTVFLFKGPYDYKKAPYLKKTKMIIDEIQYDKKFEDFADDLERLSHDYINNRRYKIERSNFPQLLNKLSEIKYMEWYRAHPEKREKQVKAIRDLKLAQKVAHFIYDLKKNKITAREIYRPLNIKKSDLERIHDLLKINWNISCPEKGISNKTVYYRPGNKRKEKYFQIGVSYE